MIFSAHLFRATRFYGPFFLSAILTKQQQKCSFFRNVAPALDTSRVLFVNSIRFGRRRRRLFPPEDCFDVTKKETKKDKKKRHTQSTRRRQRRKPLWTKKHLVEAFAFFFAFVLCSEHKKIQKNPHSSSSVCTLYRSLPFIKGPPKTVFEHTLKTHFTCLPLTFEEERERERESATWTTT